MNHPLASVLSLVAAMLFLHAPATGADVMATTVLEEADGQRLTLELTHVDGGLEPPTASMSLARAGCSGQALYRGANRNSGEIIFDEVIIGARCYKGCQLHVSRTLREYREVCRGIQRGRGTFTSSPDAEALTPWLVSIFGQPQPQANGEQKTPVRSGAEQASANSALLGAVANMLFENVRSGLESAERAKLFEKRNQLTAVELACLKIEHGKSYATESEEYHMNSPGRWDRVTRTVESSPSSSWLDNTCNRPIRFACGSDSEVFSVGPKGRTEIPNECTLLRPNPK